MTRLRERRLDLVLIAFFVVNLGFITYFFDIEQITVPDAVHFTHYPAWPPHAIVDLVHWYGNRWDPVLMNRPAFYRATIWIDVLAFGPFYACAIYAFIRGRGWIRVPALVWSGVMMANVTMILFEERYGEFATSHFGMVAAANACWFVFPVLVIARMWRDQPFGRRSTVVTAAATPQLQEQTS
jgi:emopamil binding protein